jgi:hypothetical protein
VIFAVFSAWLLIGALLILKVPEKRAVRSPAGVAR